MVGTILKIKTTIPPGSSGILPRPDIQEALEQNLLSKQGFFRQLTLISAPAGYGKTTLIRSWLEQHLEQVAWLTLDPDDNERTRFWVYLISALQTQKPILGAGPLSLLQDSAGPDPSADSFLIPLLNDLLDLENPLFLVLDDYHLIDNPQIHNDLVFFLENLPPEVHLIVASRSDPPWPLARWRARRKMEEVRQEQLRFSPDETRQLFQNLDLPALSADQFQVVLSKTEGWITGLQLLSLSLSRAADPGAFIETFAASHRSVFYFLSEEVFDREPREIQEFLLITSLLPRFSVSLCNAVTGRKDSSALVAELQEKNLFIIPLDEEGYWFRYHHLFAEFLARKLKTAPALLPAELHHKASTWFQNNNLPQEAIDHALAAGDQERAAFILNKDYEKIAGAEDPGLRSRLLNRLSPDLIKKHPRLIAQKVLFQLVQKGQKEARQWLNLFGDFSCQSPNEKKELDGLRAAVEAYYHIYTQNYSGAREMADKALKLLPSPSIYWRMSALVFSGDLRLLEGSPREALPFYQEAHRENLKRDNLYLSLSTGAKLTNVFNILGQPDAARELIQQNLEEAREKGLSRMPRVGAFWALQGELLREQGHLEEADRCLERSLAISRPEKPSWAWNLLFKIALLFSRGCYQEALSACRKLEETHQEVSLPRFIINPGLIWQARLFLQQGQKKKARQVLTRLGIKAEQALLPGMEWGYLCLARLMVSDNCSGAELREFLGSLEKKASQGEQKGLFLEIILLKTILEDRKGNSPGADQLFNQALAVGLEGGFFQTFIDQGEPLKPVLIRRIDCSPQAEGEKRQLELARKILSILSPRELTTPAKKSQSPVSSFLVEDLTTRELDILRLINRGLSNQDIAQKLFLSPNTVKWYNSNIFGKLGVNSRTQAVVEARRLNLIPSD